MKKSKKQERIATLCDQAHALLRDGKHEAALANFTTLEKLEPEQPDWPRRAAECHRGLDDRPGQIEALGRAAERFMGQGALAKAIAMSRMILNLDPAHTRTQQRLLELQRGATHYDPAEQAKPEPPQRRRLVAAPAPEKPVAPPAAPAPPPAAKADANPRPRLEQILRQRRAQSRERRPAPPEAPEVLVAEREPIALGPEPSVTAPEPIDLEPIAAPPEPSVASEREPVVVAAPEPTAISPEPVAAAPADELLDPEPEIVPDELIIQSLPPPEPSEAAALLAPSLAAIPHAPVPPSDDAVTLRPARFAAAQEAAEPGVLPFLSTASAHPLFASSQALRGRNGSPSGMFRLALDDVAPTETALEAGPVAEPSRADARPAGHTLPTTPLFSELDPESLGRVISHATIREVSAGEIVYRQNDPSDALFVVVSGSVAVLADGNERVELYELGENEFFGETALVSNELRLHTVEALESTILLCIDRALLRDLVTSQPRMLKVALRFLRERLVDGLLLTSPLFTIVPKVERRALVRRFDFLELGRGSVLIEQGEPSPGLFVLLCGTVEVLRHGGSETNLLALLHAGGIFGEMSLINGEPAMANVRSMSQGFALMLPEAAFRELVARHPEVLDFLTLLATARRGQNQALSASIGASSPPASDPATRARAP